MLLKAVVTAELQRMVELAADLVNEHEQQGEDAYVDDVCVQEVPRRMGRVAYREAYQVA